MTNRAVAKRRADALEATPDAVQAERQRRVAQMRRDAQSAFAAIDGWQRVQTEEEWLAVCEQAGRDYRSGRFLVERLGAEGYLDPELMATLWALRQRLVAGGAGTAAEAMLADLAVASYANTIKIQRWIGDLALCIEKEFFGGDGPALRYEERYGRAEGLVVLGQLERLGEELLPLLDRANRMTVRTLKAMADAQRGPAPAVAIGQAGQVNLGHGAQQVNVAQDAHPLEDDAVPIQRSKRNKRPSP